ncbi:MAG: HU family DNA-binding protein [Pseudonocardiaceae bacterium]
MTGFGVFEKRARAARMVRNPRTGQSVKIKKTNVPTFRPGTPFREVVSGARKLPGVGASPNGAGVVRPAASMTSKFTASHGPVAPIQSAPVPSSSVQKVPKAAKATKKAKKGTQDR